MPPESQESIFPEVMALAVNVPAYLGSEQPAVILGPCLSLELHIQPGQEILLTVASENIQNLITFHQKPPAVYRRPLTLASKKSADVVSPLVV